MKLHRFARFSSTHALCGITYSTVCDRGDAYVLSDADESRFPVTCEACILAKSSKLVPRASDKRAAPMGVGCQGTRDKATGISRGDEIPVAVALQEAC